MVEESKIMTQVQHRRAFVKTAAKVAVTAPAAAMLLNASVKPAMAQTHGYITGGDDARAFTDDAQADDKIITNPGDDGFS